MAPRLVYESKVKLPPPAWSRELCYEEGNRVIALDDVSENHLVLNSEILGRASIFFKASQRNDWGEAATTTRHHPTDRDRNRPLSYTNSLGFYLTAEDRDIAVFYLSSDAHGFTHRRRYEYHPGNMSWNGSRAVDNALHYLRKIRTCHKVMFKLLYKERIHEWLEYEDMADIAAYAELYDLLSETAPGLRNILLEKPGIWKDVKKEYHFHIALARKLKCEEIFLDAMHWDLIVHMHSKLPVSENVRASESQPSFKTPKPCLSLATYIPNTGPKYAALGPGHPVKTAFFSSTHVPTHLGRVQELARQIFIDWFTHQHLGEKHQSYVRENPDPDAGEAGWETDDYDHDDWFAPRQSTNGVYLPSSLRKACNYAVEASQSGRELELFDENAAEAFVRRSSLAASPYVTLEVQTELTRIVNQMSNMALPLVAPREHKGVKADRYPSRGGFHQFGTLGFAHTHINELDMGIESGDQWDPERLIPEIDGVRYDMIAHDDSNIYYSTATEISGKHVPWNREEPLGESYDVCDVQPASKK
ncbi:hypothetical protein CERZMDRAFT_99956 [Cercospora zeae-maydis SCOH1-5]|uniref:Uncharacterized protein n=1 Tax=Cercospora zeae-maydis SCOH1-5 TaxID=717836 RepID=A0A6A6F931_9PEZI|nr:hypothetical protein CERZMDRAFT_99956 [Cercospora zeae-maydis SCOH1-5]